MSVTGEFLADFDKFIAEAQKARDELDKLEKTTGGLGDTTDKSLKSFDFEKFFTSPIKTSTAAAKDFIGGIEGWGAVALGAAAGIGALVAGAVALGNATADTASNLGDLAVKTGMTVPQLSKLSTAAELAGTNIGAVSDVSYTMQQRMRQNPGEFADGLAKLGINAKDFAALDMAGRVETFTRALAAQDDQTARNIAGQEIAGKQYKEIGSSLVNMGEWAIDASDGIGHLFTEEDKKNADEYKKQVALMKGELKGLADDIGSIIVPALGWLTKHLREAWEAGPGADWKKSKEEAAAWGIVFQQMGLKAAEAGPPIKDAWAAAHPPPSALTDLKAFRDEFASATAIKARDAEITKELAEQERERAALQKANQVEWDKYAAALKEIAQAGEGWRDTLSKMNQATVDAIEHDLRAGASQAAVALSYDKTAVQIRAVASSIQSKDKTLDDSAKREHDTVQTLQGLWQTYYDTIAAGEVDSTQKQIDAVWRKANATELALIEQGKWSKDASDLIVAIAQKQTDNILAQELSKTKGTREYYQTMVKEAEAAYALALQHSTSYTAADTELLRVKVDTAKAALAEFKGAAEQSLTDVASVADVASAAVGKAVAAVTSMHDQWNAATRSASSPFHQGVNAFGKPVLLNENNQQVGGELQAQYGSAGFLGYGLPQGQTMQTLININGILMANDPAARQQLADVVGRSVSDSLKSQGVRLGSGV